MKRARPPHVPPSRSMARRVSIQKGRDPEEGVRDLGAPHGARCVCIWCRSQRKRAAAP